MTKVELLDPIHTMSRGWSITRDAQGNVVRSVRDVAQGDILVTTVADGDVTSTVGKP
jgi:exodeoxyribonuclease VII large subunit